jgi:hypothetical protein
MQHRVKHDFDKDIFRCMECKKEVTREEVEKSVGGLIYVHDLARSIPAIQRLMS